MNRKKAKQGALLILTAITLLGILTACNAQDKENRTTETETSIKSWKASDRNTNTPVRDAIPEEEYYGCPNSKRIRKINMRKKKKTYIAGIK